MQCHPMDLNYFINSDFSEWRSTKYVGVAYRKGETHPHTQLKDRHSLSCTATDKWFTLLIRNLILSVSDVVFRIKKLMKKHAPKSTDR